MYIGYINTPLYDVQRNEIEIKDKIYLEENKQKNVLCVFI